MTQRYLDTFTESSPPVAATSHTPDLNFAGYTAVSGTFNVGTIPGSSHGNCLFLQTTSGTGNNLLVYDPGVLLQAFSVRMWRGFTTSQVDEALVFNYLDANNFWWFRFIPASGKVYLFRRVSGTDTEMANAAITSATDTFYEFRVDGIGTDTVTCKVDGITYITYSVGTRPLKSERWIGFWTGDHFGDNGFDDAKGWLAASTGFTGPSFYLVGEIAPGSQFFTLRDATAPSDGIIQAGWQTPNTLSPTKYCLMAANLIQASGNFVSTEPSSAPDNSLGDCFRSEDKLTVSWSSANWASVLSAIAQAAGGSQDVSLRYQLWKGSAADGSDATTLFSSTFQDAGSFVNLATGSPATQSANVLPSAISLSDEYLFMQIVLRLDGSGSGATNDAFLYGGSSYAKLTPPASGGGFVPPPYYQQIIGGVA